MSKEFEINGKFYTYEPLNTFTQLFACRKTSILFSALSKGYPLLDVIYDIPQADLMAVMAAVMPHVSRKDIGGVWAKIFNKDAGLFSFSDISGSDAIEILLEVLTDYVPPFLIAINRLESATQTAKAESGNAPI